MAGKPKNRRTPEFKAAYNELPERIQKLGVKAFRQFCKDPSHPSLRHGKLGDNKRGSHQPGSWSVSITMQYRAVYVVVDAVNVWYWVGTHAQIRPIHRPSLASALAAFGVGNGMRPCSRSRLLPDADMNYRTVAPLALTGGGDWVL